MQYDYCIKLNNTFIYLYVHYVVESNAYLFFSSLMVIVLIYLIEFHDYQENNVLCVIFSV